MLVGPPSGLGGTPKARNRLTRQTAQFSAAGAINARPPFGPTVGLLSGHHHGRGAWLIPNQRVRLSQPDVKCEKHKENTSMTHTERGKTRLL